MLCFAKIVVKNDYTKKGDLVFRPLIRAYKEIGAKPLIHNGNAILMGMIDKDGIFHEMFTGNEIYCDFYEQMDFGEVYEIKKQLTPEDAEKIHMVINNVVFNKRIPVSKSDGIAYEWTNAPDYESEKKRIEENDEDLRVETRAYQNDLSVINPFDKENLSGYNDFLYKVSKINELSLNKSK